MNYNKIIIAFLCFLVICLFITTSTINKHKEEIDFLRQRVDNLETVINQNVKITKSVKKAPDLYLQ